MVRGMHSQGAFRRFSSEQQLKRLSIYGPRLPKELKLWGNMKHKEGKILASLVTVE